MYVGRCAVAMSVIATAVPRQIVAQAIAIVPHLIVANSRTHTAAITLVNQGAHEAEVSLSTFFGYAVTDSVGHMHLRTFQTVADTMPSAAAWVQVFPQRLHIAPHHTRVVRLLVEPPETVPDGEYWARLVITTQSRGGVVTQEPNSHPSGMRVGMTVQVNSLVPFLYRNGTVATGVRISHVEAAVEKDSVVARVRLIRQGNAAFMGTLKAVLRDAQGRQVAQGILPLGVYYTLYPRLPIAVHDVKPGRYVLTVNVIGQREDIDPTSLLPASAVQAFIPVEIP